MTPEERAHRIANPKPRSAKQQAVQEKWLKLGTHIRQLLCMDSIAARYVTDAQHRDLIRKVVDNELNKLGYETLTSREQRYHEGMANWEKSGGPLEFSKDFYKLRKLDKGNGSPNSGQSEASDIRPQSDLGSRKTDGSLP